MSRSERWGTRDLAYSRWHRTLPDRPAVLDYIDVDGLEYCHTCREPLALVEVARDVGQFKPTIVLERLAKRAGIPAVLVLYRHDDAGNLAAATLYRLPDRAVLATTLDGLAAWLYRLRADHFAHNGHGWPVHPVMPSWPEPT